jgi:thymidylate synthase
MSQEAFMSQSADLSALQYAVIEALQNEAVSERFVIAYRNEESLHNVIAAPCIIATGFASREEAIVRSEALVAAAAA